MPLIMHDDFLSYVVKLSDVHEKYTTLLCEGVLIEISLCICIVELGPDLFKQLNQTIF